MANSDLHQYGALAYEWRQIAGIKELWGDILEVVSAPESVIPSGTDGAKRGRGKMPGKVINGKAVGIVGWTTKPLGGQELLEQYEAEACTDKGFWRGAFLRTGHNSIIGADCDTEDPEKAHHLLNVLANILGKPVIAVRSRKNSPRWVVLIKISDGPAFYNKVVVSAPPVKGPDGQFKPQQLEFLGAGCGIVLAGTHTSGERYEWKQGIKIYEMTRKQFEEFRDIAADVLTEGLSEREKNDLIGPSFDIRWCETEEESRQSRGSCRLADIRVAELIEGDPGIEYLKSINYPIMGNTADGGVIVRCPNWKEHTTNDDTAAYYPVGHPRCAETGGFKCLHAHCSNKGRQWFLKAIRDMPEFKDAPEPDPSCFIIKPYEIKFEDESEAAEAGEVKKAQKERERQERRDRLDSLGTFDRDAQGAEEKGDQQISDMIEARKALQPFIIRNKKDGSYNEQSPSYYSTFVSVYTAIQYPVFCGLDMKFDTYKRVITVRKYGTVSRRPIRDIDYISVLNQLERNGFHKNSKEKVIDQIQLYAGISEYDELAEYVRKYVPAWDGVPRIDTMFTEHFHAVLSESQTPAYYAAAARYFMMAMVKRALTPNEVVKADDVLVFQGDQGCGKSTAVACFALRREDALEGLSFTDDAGEWAIRINGHIVAEVPEMNGYNKREISDIKFILSQGEDTYRPKYERTTVTRPRRCMIILTTNEYQSLTDNTGNRRFLVIEVAREQKIDIAWLRENMYQLWAEAIYMLEQSDGYIPQREAEEAAVQVTEIFVRADPLEEDILKAAILRDQTSVNGVSVRDIIADIGSGTGLLPDMRGEKRVADILRGNGWGQVRVRSDQGTKIRRWRRK